MMQKCHIKSTTKLSWRYYKFEIQEINNPSMVWIEYSSQINQHDPTKKTVEKPKQLKT